MLKSWAHTNTISLRCGTSFNDILPSDMSLKFLRYPMARSTCMREELIPLFHVTSSSVNWLFPHIPAGTFNVTPEMNQCWARRNSTPVQHKQELQPYFFNVSFNFLETSSLHAVTCSYVRINSYNV